MQSLGTYGMALAALIVASVAALGCFFSAAPSECIEAAEEAGLPDSVIVQLRNPGDLNAIERAALNRILSEAGIDDVCEVAAGAAESDGALSPAQTEGSSSRQSNESTTRAAASSDASKSRNEELTKEAPRGQQHGLAYAECLDEVYLRASDDYDDEYWLSAAIWYCRELMPAPLATAAATRCNLDQIEATQIRFPEWDDVLHRWHALAICNPLPTPDTTYIGGGSAIQPTTFSACLDNAYLTNVELVGSNEVTVGISTWFCQDYLPEPPAVLRQRCDLNHIAETQELYPEWPEDLHKWHAIMQCLPEWQLSHDTSEDVYPTCLADVYWQVADRYSNYRAIAAAVWQCKGQMPEPPAIYNPRCEINHHRRDEESQLQLPDELYAWNAIVQCYPSPVR